MCAQSANTLLAALPRADYRRILPELRSTLLTAGDKLGKCGETRIYFPGAGLCSVRAEMEDGRRIEIAAVGKEGLVGFANITGNHTPKRSFLQLTDGFAQYMTVSAFEREMARGGEFSMLVERFSRTFLDSAMQLAACNRMHSMQERYCRWILMMSDRVGRMRINLNAAACAGALGSTHQQLAVITKTLQNLNVLEFVDDQLVIYDRQTLERFACDCYPMMKRRLEPVDVHRGEADRARVVSIHAVGTEPAGPRLADPCNECGIAAATPHRTDLDCIRALDAEMKLLLHRARRLQAHRVKIFARHLKAVSTLAAQIHNRKQ